MIRGHRREWVAGVGSLAGLIVAALAAVDLTRAGTPGLIWTAIWTSDPLWLARWGEALVVQVIVGLVLSYRLTFRTAGGQALGERMGLPRLLLVMFLAVLLALARKNEIPISGLLSVSLVRVGMNLVLGLALIPMVEGGLGLNFGLPLGLVCGLFGVALAMEVGRKPFPILGFSAPFLAHGLVGLGFAMAVGTALAAVFGWLFGLLLNRVRGDEMMVGTYLGFSVVAAAKIFWVVAPFHSPDVIFPIGGNGLRTTLLLSDYFGNVLDKILAFQVSPVGAPADALIVPTGLIAFGALVGAGLELFSRTPMGVAIRTAGSNPVFARSCGIDDDRTRVQATMLSTMIGAVGIVVYAQAFGFAQLYDAPLMMAFPAVACLLIGGGTVDRATVTQVVLGTLLFETLLAIAVPVCSSIFTGDLPEVMRLIITNGMILYALTRTVRR